jgi:hypothetical protein
MRKIKGDRTLVWWGIKAGEMTLARCLLRRI